MMKLAWMLALAGAVGCDQRRRVGGERGQPDPVDMMGTGGVQIQNLVARVARQYECPAGRISNVDDVASCGCNQSAFECELAGGVPCTCDPGCVGARPMIGCADYALTFALRNGSAKPMARMTEVKVTLGELVVHEGGLECDVSSWTLASGESSGIIEVAFEYDSSSSTRYARSSIDYPCSNGPEDGSVDTGPDDLGEPMPPAVTSGQAMIEVRGLFEDASPWMISGVADL
jgi:hypothetical protein